MSSNEMPVEQARKVLGDLVASAQLAGVVTTITRYGRPAALITPIPQEPTMSFADLRDQITASITDQGEGIDVEAVAEEIRDRFGVVDIDTIDSDEYWAIVRRHDATQAEPVLRCSASVGRSEFLPGPGGSPIGVTHTSGTCGEPGEYVGSGTVLCAYHREEEAKHDEWLAKSDRDLDELGG